MTSDSLLTFLLKVGISRMNEITSYNLFFTFSRNPEWHNLWSNEAIYGWSSTFSSTLTYLSKICDFIQVFSRVIEYGYCLNPMLWFESHVNCVAKAPKVRIKQFQVTYTSQSIQSCSVLINEIRHFKKLIQLWLLVLNRFFISFETIDVQIVYLIKF